MGEMDFQFFGLGFSNGDDGFESRPKWPISINCRNIWPNSTVCEIISHLPLFGVLELGELEYSFFLSTVAPDHQHV